MAKNGKHAVKALPHVVAALICEKVLFEKDDVGSLIRVVDRLNIPDPATTPGLTNDAQDPVFMDFALFVAFKSGKAKGEYTLTIDTITPSGSKRKGQPVTIAFLGAHHGVNVRGILPIFMHESGVHWYEIKVDGKLLTRTPLEIVYLTPTTEGERASKKASPETT